MLSSVKKPRLSRFLPLVLLVFVGLAAAGCSGAPSRGWSGPWVSDNILYVGTLQGKIVALDLATAVLSDGIPPDPLWDPKVVAEPKGRGFGCSGGVSTAMGIYGTPVVKNGRIYIGAYSGTVLWITTDGLGESNVPFETDGSIVGSVVIDGETLFVGSSDGTLYAIDLNLKEKWRFDTEGEIWSTPFVKDHVVYVASADHNLYAIDAESGNEIWRFETKAAILSTPLVANGKVYIGGCDRKFYAIEAATEDERVAASNGEPTTRDYDTVFDGAKNWFWTQAMSYEGKIYVGCLDGKIYVFDALDVTEPVDEFDVGSPIKSPPLIVGASLLVGTQDGMLYFLNPQDLGASSASIDLEAPILAPMCPDPLGSLVYVHAQDGEHTINAVDVSVREVVWTYRTDKITG